MYNELEEKLFFTKEAADYLGISTQRLNMLVKEGKVKPLKKSVSGTIFHIDELESRKEEQRIFTREPRGVKKGHFDLDTCEKREALNFATLMNALDITEQKLDPLFEKFSEEVDVTICMDEDQALFSKYSAYFNVSKDILTANFKNAKITFSNLKSTDEVVKRGNEDYPPLLQRTEQAPRFLYLRGNKSLLYEERTVALVGSRKASAESKENTRRLAIALGRNGITIISGLARGIDVAAHKAALDNGYNTIAVIGTNLNQYYPNENKGVQMEIERRGLVVSQFSPASKTQRWFFPLRNGVMSGLSLATIIMEAGETSGALKQADFALKQRREVLIPENVLKMKTITWPAKYVSRGAKEVKSPKHVLEILAESNIYKVKEDTIRQQTFEELFNRNVHVDEKVKSKLITKIIERS